MPLARLVFQRATEMRCPIARLRSATRSQSAVEARWAIAKEAHALGYSYSTIGRALNRDHTTIMHALGALHK